jgi:hypothetical protein
VGEADRLEAVAFVESVSMGVGLKAPKFQCRDARALGDSINTLAFAGRVENFAIPSY